MIEGERVATGFRFDQRLMQVPTARHRIRKRRAAHEAGQEPVAARDLLNGGAKQHHGVGGVEAKLRAKSEFALAGAQLNLDRAQGQTKLLDAAPKYFDGGVEQIEARFGEVLIALR